MKRMYIRNNVTVIDTEERRKSTNTFIRANDYSSEKRFINKRDSISHTKDKDTLSIEKQNIISTFVSTLSSKIEVINIIVNSNSRLEPFSILISFYLLNIELDFLFNALLFSDDVMSQKYKNNGELSFYTTFLLSILSTCISNIISILFKKILSFIPVPLLIHKEQLDEVKPL